MNTQKLHQSSSTRQADILGRRRHDPTGGAHAVVQRAIETSAPWQYRLPSDGRQWRHLIVQRHKLTVYLAGYKACYPGLGRISRDLHWSRRTTARLLADLKLLGVMRPMGFVSERGTRLDEILAPINANSQDVRGTMSVAAFITTYLDEIKETKRASTYKNYRDIARLHVCPRLGQSSLRAFRCVDGERLLGNVARQARTPDGRPLSRSSLTRVKSFLSGVFKTAKRKGCLDGINPMCDTSIVGGTPQTITYAYSLAEIRAMLAVLSEPTRTVVLTAAFTGLRSGEIRGLRWEDFDGKQLHVRRSMWHSFENKPKTVASAASIPIVRQLAEALEAHRLRTGQLALPGAPIFASGIGTPLNLANVAKRIIVPAIEKCLHCRRSKVNHRTDGHLFERDKSLAWHGWHGFRRGLATNLHSLGVPDKEIQSILRHSDIAITMKSYVKCLPESRINALDLVAAEMENTESCNQNATEPKGPVN